MTYRVLVTGGSGFIGSNLIKYLLHETGAVTLNVTRLGRAGNPAPQAAIAGSLYQFAEADIANRPAMRAILHDFQPDLVIHLAAETRVDSWVDNPASFIQTNVIGTAALLQEAHGYWRNLPPDRAECFRFHHVSTVEVFGSLAAPARADATTRYDPSSLYSASKAAADHIVRAWYRTHKLPVVLSICGNNYGPNQLSNRFIPAMISKALAGEPLLLYGTGENVRDWIYVEDHVRALWTVATKGVVGETYLIGADAEKRNIDVARLICRILDELIPDAAGDHERLISLVADRPGNDFRYAIDNSRLRRELNFTPRESFESGLRSTVVWYLDRRNARIPQQNDAGRGRPEATR